MKLLISDSLLYNNLKKVKLFSKVKIKLIVNYY